MNKPPPERPLRVGELARRIQHLLEEGVGRVSVEGEVSNLRIPSSGHCYFALKDADAAINAVCFRSALARQSVRPVDGMAIEVRGRVTAYTPRSEYQIVVESLREAGLGELMRRFLELKEKLKAEGLFDAARKREIPRLPRTIGVVTSSTGAALRDILNILRRRTGAIEILISPAAVQGEAAPGEIVRALERLQRHGRAEVIIAGRGGGSIEDLWAFNDERVVRAIAACKVPVISAVGHETDTTLADYAADLRAPTPSAAAELVSANYGEIAASVAQWRRRLGRVALQRIDERRARIERCRASWGMRKPRERVAQGMQRLDDLHDRLNKAARRKLDNRAQLVERMRDRLAAASPRRRVEWMHSRLAHLREMLVGVGPRRWTGQLTAARATHQQLSGRLRTAIQSHLARDRWRAQGLGERLAALDPEAVLGRGFSIVTHGKRDRIVTQPDQVRPNETVRIRSAGGRWRAAVLPPEDDLFDLSE